jgi:hypothetical protein
MNMDNVNVGDVCLPFGLSAEKSGKLDQLRAASCSERFYRKHFTPFVPLRRTPRHRNAFVRQISYECACVKLANHNYEGFRPVLNDSDHGMQRLQSFVTISPYTSTMHVDDQTIINECSLQQQQQQQQQQPRNTKSVVANCFAISKVVTVIARLCLPLPKRSQRKVEFRLGCTAKAGAPSTRSDQTRSQTLVRSGRESVRRWTEHATRPPVCDVVV